MEKLDVRGKICPFPLFYAKRKITEMKPGEELEIIADDSTAKETIQKAKLSPFRSNSYDAFNWNK